MSLTLPLVWFYLVAQSPDELALALLNTPRQNWTIDATPLRERPVIRVAEGRYACPDLAFLARCLTDRMYFLLRDAYPDGQFSQLFGHIFERYITQYFRQFSCESDLLVRTFYSSPKFQGTSDQAGDGILVWLRTALVMEYKARVLTVREKYAMMEGATHAGVDDIIGKEKPRKGVFQLARVIDRLLEGEQVVADSPNALELSGYEYIHPVIVTYEESVGLESIRQQAEEKFESALNADTEKRQRVGPLLLFTVGEIEILEGLARKFAVEELIRDYASYVRANLKDRAGSFRSFVYNSKYNETPHKPAETSVGELCQKAWDEIGQEVSRREAAALDRPLKEGPNAAG